jgi:hypothetical protein
MEAYRDEGGSDDYPASRDILNTMLTHLSSPPMMTCAQDVLEEWITTAGRELQRQLMQDQLDARARAEPRRPVLTGADQVTRRRSEPGLRRQLATTVGTVEVERIAYRAPNSSNLYPADAILALPRARYSHPLQRLIALEAARGAVRAASDTVAERTGVRLGTRQIIDCAERAACDILSFYQDQVAAAPSKDPADLLVLSMDATGVKMIAKDLREATRAAAKAAAEQEAGTAAGQAPSAQLSRKDRAGRKRMATVTALYDTTPSPREACDILPSTRAEREARTPGPVARNRRLDASLERTTPDMVAALFDAAHERDPGHHRRWIALVDGANHQLDRLHAEAELRGIHLEIVVDFVHVLEYLWRAADELHPTKPARTAWVADTARQILGGASARVVTDIQAALRATSDKPQQYPATERAITYLTAKEPYLHYHLALALGWPIATGVIEGSCRFLVKDRLDVTGARWSLDGAGAILLLRAVIDNGDFDAYWRYHTQQEYQRTHAIRYQDQFDLAA